MCDHPSTPDLGAAHLDVERLSRRVESLEGQATLLEAIVDSLSDPVVLTDRRNSFLFASRRAKHLFSADPDANEGRRRAIHINNLLFESFLTQALAGAEEPVGREINLVDPSEGSDLLFEALTVPLPPGAGEEGAVISVLRDITDLRRALTELELQFKRSKVAEEHARRESERLNAILENVSDPILVTNAESRIILANAEADRLFDAAGSAPPRDDSSRWALRTNDTQFTTLVSDFLLQPDNRRVDTLQLTHPASGRELPVEVVSSKILNRRGEAIAIVSVLHDLTQVMENERLTSELQRLNEELEERVRLATEELEERNRRLEWQSRELERATRLKSEFLANMSHELRTPINAMLGYTALLRERIYGGLNEKQENALAKVYVASQHLLALINDVLDLSKIEAGKMALQVEEISLRSVVSELSQTIEPMLREKGLAYRTEVSGDLPLLRTDLTRIKQILLNLLSNAVKFTPSGSVTLRACLLPGGDRFRVEVEDTGIGIRGEDVDAIFEDFRQADTSATRTRGGTGLGLSITRKLLALMGGEIGVESRYGEGSTFWIVLPVELPTETDPAEPRPSRSERTTEASTAHSVTAASGARHGLAGRSPGTPS